VNEMVHDKAIDDGADDAGSVWRKSSCSYSTGQCVQIAAPDGAGIAVRDSKNPQGAVLRFTPAGWREFVASVRSGEIS
jgi:Domain of unknown function (DUF397)